MDFMRRRRQSRPQQYRPRMIAIKKVAAPAHLNSPRDERLVALETPIQGTAVAVGHGPTGIAPGASPNDLPSRPRIAPRGALAPCGDRPACLGGNHGVARLPQ